MKNNQVSIFVFLILSAVIGGVLFFVNRSSQEYLGWSPDEMYGDLSRAAYDGSAFTNATFSGSSNGGGVALSMQGGSLSSRARVSSFRPITSHQYPIANSPLPISNLQSPIANGPSPIAYMTSGAEFRSFGGGGNGSAGSAGTFRTNSQSPITNIQLPISNIQLPIANNQSPISNSQLPIANTPSSMFGYELKTTVGTASYGMMSYYANNGNGRSNVRGRQNANPWDSWLSWLYENEKGDWGRATGSDETGWIYTYTREQLEAAYNEWKKTYGQSWGPNPPSFEVWWEWMLAGGYDGYMYGNNTYRWVPVGDILPLLLIALLYLVFVAIKSKSLKSLLKTERSE